MISAIMEKKYGEFVFIIDLLLIPVCIKYPGKETLKCG
jgi:hypothetical protein